MRPAFIFFVMLLICAACKPSTSAISSREKGEKEFQNYVSSTANHLLNQSAPDFQLLDLQGNTVKLSDYKGKIVLLNFWFMNCAPCVTEISSLRELHKNYSDKNVVLLAVSTDDAELLPSFVAQKDLPYRVLANGKSTAERYKVKVYPTTYLIDKQGVVKEVFLGASDWDGTQTYREIKPKLEALMAKE